tara:strand:+ start:1475 stop:1627 length:153 start_codon:yes stop_codon:yes gene_type:complete
MKNTEELNNIIKRKIDCILDIQKLEVQILDIKIKRAKAELAEKRRISNDI